MPYPRGIAFDAGKGRFFVTDPQRNRLQIYNKLEGYLETSVQPLGILGPSPKATSQLGLAFRTGITQVALLAVAYFTGTDFKPAKRLPAKDNHPLEYVGSAHVEALHFPHGRLDAMGRRTELPPRLMN